MVEITFWSSKAVARVWVDAMPTCATSELANWPGVRENHASSIGLSAETNTVCMHQNPVPGNWTVKFQCGWSKVSAHQNQSFEQEEINSPVTVLLDQSVRFLIPSSDGPSVIVNFVTTGATLPVPTTETNRRAPQRKSLTATPDGDP